MKKYSRRVAIALGAILLLSYAVAYVAFAVNGFLPIGHGLSKSDWLSFYGSFISLLGTAFLGWIAFRQNEQLNEMTQKLLRLEERRQIPTLVVSDYKLYSNSLVITFKNISEATAHTISINAIRNSGGTDIRSIFSQVILNPTRAINLIVKNDTFDCEMSWTDSSPHADMVLTLTALNEHLETYPFTYQFVLSPDNRYIVTMPSA
jgi:hypothetical protein